MVCVEETHGDQGFNTSPNRLLLLVSNHVESQRNINELNMLQIAQVVCICMVACQYAFNCFTFVEMIAPRCHTFDMVTSS